MEYWINGVLEKNINDYNLLIRQTVMRLLYHYSSTPILHLIGMPGTIVLYSDKLSLMQQI